MPLNRNIKKLYKTVFESIILCVHCHTARVRRKNLTQKELEKIRDYTPALAKGNSRMFRDLRDKGNQSLLIIIYFPYIAYIDLIHFICCGSIKKSLLVTLYCQRLYKNSLKHKLTARDKEPFV